MRKRFFIFNNSKNAKLKYMLPFENNIAYWRNDSVCCTYCTGHRHRPLSQHGLTEAVLGESVFTIDLASISYIEREESISGHGPSPPKHEKTLKLCGFKVFLLPKNRHSAALEFYTEFRAFKRYSYGKNYDEKSA